MVMDFFTASFLTLWENINGPVTLNTDGLNK